MVDDSDGEPRETLILGGEAYARLRLGEEEPPGESPCPGCGAYYFVLHEAGCDGEQCPRCRGSIATCGCR